MCSVGAHVLGQVQVEPPVRPLAGVCKQDMRREVMFSRRDWSDDGRTHMRILPTPIQIAYTYTQSPRHRKPRLNQATRDSTQRTKSYGIRPIHSSRPALATRSSPLMPLAAH